MVGLWLAISSAAASSCSGPLAKSLIEQGWTPATLTMVRALGAGLVLLIPAALVLRGRWSQAAGGWSGMLMLGVFGVGGTSICFYNAISLLPISVALLVQYSAPVLVLLYTWARWRRPPRRVTLIGVAFAIAGLMLVVGIGGDDRTNLEGLTWAVSGAMCFAVYFIASESSSAAVPPIALACVTLLIGGTTVAVCGLVGVLPIESSRDAVTLAGAQLGWAWPVALLVLVPTVFTYTTSMASVGMLGARVSSFVSLSELIFAVFTAWVLVGEAPRWAQLIGGLVLITGIVLVRKDDADAMRVSLLSPDPVVE